MLIKSALGHFRPSLRPLPAIWCPLCPQCNRCRGQANGARRDCACFDGSERPDRSHGPGDDGIVPVICPTRQMIS